MLAFPEAGASRNILSDAVPNLFNGLLSLRSISLRAKPFKPLPGAAFGAHNLDAAECARVSLKLLR
jgi:hypothetical protein